MELLDRYTTYFLEANCKILFNTFVDKESKHLKWTDLIGS